MFTKLKQFFSDLFNPSKTFIVEEIEDIQLITPKSKHIYIEKRGGKNRWLHILCPSGCGELISVNLMKSIYPNWKVTRNRNNTVTLFPSIDKVDGCRSHFFIRESKIEWALPHSS